LTEETKGMINAQVVNEAEPGLIFVNTARGMLIESLDLIEQSLKSGQMAAAGLDVLPVEPPQSHSLIDAWRNHEEWLKGRLIITPHNAFYSDYSMYEARYNAAETARLFLQENKHRNAVSEIL
jgi:D-3-phosphoglycerate dehydrogenase